ncbi:cation transport protein-domain-containing protein [Russula vinacea]|nr:cation transport protein-domain-containing protein [Russula vinacea]
MSLQRAFQRLYSFLCRNLNFYRCTFFTFRPDSTFTPLIFSGVFYASNGLFHIAYIDALFNCVSAMAVCGLASVDLSSLTAWQQVILFIQLCLGNPVLISWVVVFVRRRMFTVHCENIVRAATRKTTPGTPGAERMLPHTLTTRIASMFGGGSMQLAFLGSRHGSSPSSASNMEGPRSPRRLRPDMIRRVDDAPKLVNPSGWISEGQAGPTNVRSTNQADNWDHHHPRRRAIRNSSSPGNPAHHQMRHSSIGTGSSNERAIPGLPTVRTQTIEFAPYPLLRHRTSPQETTLRTSPPQNMTFVQSTGNNTTTPLYRSETMRTSTAHRGTNANFGGFPGPPDIISRLIRRFFPGVHRQLTRTLTMPRTTTITSMRGNTERARPVPYVSFDAVVGHNSSFEELTEEQLEELGGVEFRALNALLWIVGIYHICVQLAGFTIIAPYISSNKWKNNFRPPQQKRLIIPAWFSLFQVVSAYTNAGMSLVDQSMVPFQRAYPMIFAMIFLILAGNTAFVIINTSLRFSVWATTKLVPEKSQLNETLHFLLDHPRRCFIYLFPSHQTWFLLTVLFILNTTDWFFFLLLDIGNTAIESIPVGVRVIDGLLQATAVRAAGFAIVNLSALAPAVKVLYVIMIVRSTNVYEERSLGIYDDSSIEEEDFSLSGNRMTVWGNYLAMHARKQLAFDMWWLGLALFLLCIIERDQLEKKDNATWFNIFSIVFELVSAYGGVGLSLGVPYANYSFSGAFRPLSKLIVCIVMLRGRHRGLPVAIDRAVLLPFEYQQFPGDGISGPVGVPVGVARRRRLTVRIKKQQADDDSIASSPMPAQADGLSKLGNEI